METTISETRKMNKKPTKLEEMTKEQIRQAILKKKECNAKAQQIVESLLEKGITEEYLLQCLPDINQAHFDDIIEERFISHLCGYPICENSISLKDIPKQKYRISIKTNKVYDITTRKNFCCNRCYKAAMYVKKQMLTSPLWFREYEDIPKFVLMSLDSSGSMGQEIDVSLINRVQLDTGSKAFTSIHDFASASLNDLHKSDQINENKDNEEEANQTPVTSINEFASASPSDMHKSDNIDENRVNKNEVDLKITNPETILETISQNMVQLHDTVYIETSNSVNLTNLSTKQIKKPVPNPMNIVGEIVEKSERKIDPILIEQPKSKPKENKPKKALQKKQPVVTALAIEVEKCLADWFTLDTLLFLFGDDKVREMVADKGECIKEYLNNYSKGIFYNANSYDQYQQLCKKLNMLEIEDRRHDAKTLQKETKPLPEYSILQEESKKMQLKVKAFYSGVTDFPEPESTQEVKSDPDTESNVTQLPLVDKNAQNALRRRIVCEHLNKVLPDLLRSLGVLTLTISSDVRLLVNTFKLKANNIMFKPIQWTLIAIVFIKLLSIRNKRLEFLLEQPMAFQHMQLLLLSYKQDGGYLDRLISWLIDIDRLLDTNDTQLTVE